MCSASAPPTRSEVSRSEISGNPSLAASVLSNCRRVSTVSNQVEDRLEFSDDEGMRATSDDEAKKNELLFSLVGQLEKLPPNCINRMVFNVLDRRWGPPVPRRGPPVFTWVGSSPGGACSNQPLAGAPSRRFPPLVVGAYDGNDVGVNVGMLLGATVSVGVELGVPLGGPVGVLEGPSSGADVGVEMGTELGVREGPSDGAGVGADVGSTEGDTEGMYDGNAVGCIDVLGCGVGD